MSEKNYYQYSHKLPSGEIVVLNVDRDKVTQEQWWQEVDAFRDATWKKFLTNLEKETGVNTKPVDMGGNQTVKLDGEKSFQVEKIKLASGGDHPRWTVMGGNFTKFGVTCWPEVLENAGLKSLDPLKENMPTGVWTAFYTEKLKDGKAVPDKVVRLEKAG